MLEETRQESLAPFRMAGFRIKSAVMILPDGQLFQRQAQQFASEGKSVDEITIAEMRGMAEVYPTQPLVLGGGRTMFGK